MDVIPYENSKVVGPSGAQIEAIECGGFVWQETCVNGGSNQVPPAKYPGSKGE
jgi:hypothetical protein